MHKVDSLEADRGGRDFTTSNNITQDKYTAWISQAICVIAYIPTHLGKYNYNTNMLIRYIVKKLTVSV